jgi:N-acetylneuraminate synthase
MQIADRTIGPGEPPYVIAEMSGNHNQSLARALAIVDAAADAGAHAIKIQTYTADTMTLDIGGGEFEISDPDSLWHGQNLHQLYQTAHTPWEWHAAIFERARARGIACFSSPFDDSAIDLLESLGAPAYKIASFELVHLPLIRRAAATGKPLIMSTGMATLAEIDEAVAAARAAGCTQLALLKCTSTYPASPENSNLRTIAHMRALYDAEVGLSDHTMGVGAAVAAVALGATLVEKHFTLSRADGGVDSAFSLEPAELAALVTETRRAWQALGSVRYGCSAAEAPSLAYRRSLYIAADLRAGEALTRENLRCIRPGGGLAPKYLEMVLGRRVARDVRRGTALDWSLLA